MNYTFGKIERIGRQCLKQDPVSTDMLPVHCRFGPAPVSPRPAQCIPAGAGLAGEGSLLCTCLLRSQTSISELQRRFFKVFWGERNLLHINFSHFGWPRSKSRALFFWYTGALKFKMQWKVYNICKGIGVNCVIPLCPGLDEMSNQME